MPSSKSLFGVALGLAALMQSAGGGELVLAGVHSTSTNTSFPGIHVLKAFQGRIYMGYGDWGLSPAVVVASYDSTTTTFRPEHSTGTDAVGNFRVIGEDLFVPSIDPVHFDEFTDFSIRSGTVWRRTAPAGLLHVFDFTTLNGTDRWFVGAKTANETPHSGATVWRSMNGLEWSDVTLPTSVARYYYCFALRGKLYVHDTVYDGNTATRITPFPYEELYKPLNLASGSNEIVMAIAQLLPGIGSFSRQSLVSFNGTNWQTLKANVVDLTVEGSRIYTLDFNPASGSNELRVAQFDGAMPLTWSNLPLSNVASNAKAIEVMGDSIYVGDTAGRLWMGKLDGSSVSFPSTSVVNDLPDGFGRAISTDETTLVIGAPESSASAIMGGQVTVWMRATNGAGASSWQNPQVLLPPATSFSGWFGKKVAVANDVLAVLEAGADVSRSDRGSSARIHLYQRVSQIWVFRQTLTQAFAHSLAIQSNVLWVAAATDLHRYSVTSGMNGLTATLAETVSSGAPSTMYEPSARIAATQDRAAFANTGDFSRGGGPGQVDVFEREGTTWRKVTTLLQNNPPLPQGLSYQPDAFGAAVAITSDWLAVGAPRDDSAASQAGAVHLFERVLDGTNSSFVFRQKIVAPVSQQEAGFGSSLAFNGEYLVVGSPGLHSPGKPRAGRVFIYRRDETNAVFVGQIVAPSVSQTEFGAEVFLDGTTIIAGSRATDTNAEPLTRVVFRDVRDLLGSLADLAVFGSVQPVQAASDIPVHHSLIVSNAGPSNATFVVVTFDKPANGIITGFSSPEGTCTTNGTSVICVVPMLAVGSVASMQVTVQANVASPCEMMRSSVTVAAAEFDLALANNRIELRVNDLPPNVTLTSPADGTTVRFGGTIGIGAIASASNVVAEIGFYTNDVLLGSVAAEPYLLPWANVPPGTHRITARVTDQCGLVRTSAPITLIVRSNEPPSVSITSPLHRTRFMETNEVKISVSASDSDGQIAQVHLFGRNNLLHTFSSAPYLFAWTNIPLGSWPLRAMAVDNDGATNTSSEVLLVFSDQSPEATWVAYNDHAPGAATHTNATRWNIRGLAPGASGQLKSISTGSSLPVSLFITRTNPNDSAAAGAAPDANSPAAQVFGPYVDWLAGSAFANVRIITNQFVTYNFTGLNPQHSYSLKMTALRGNPGLQTQWTLLTLNGAQSFRGTHTSGVLSESAGTLAANEVAFSTGFNTAGDLASWDEIVSAPDGTFNVVATAYTGITPDGRASGTGFAPTVLRLEDATGSLPFVTTSAVSQTVSPGTTATFTTAAAGINSLRYQWLRDNAPIVGATSAVFNLAPVQHADAGRYTVRVSDTNGHAMSRSAILTVFSIETNRELVMSGPLGQRYRVEACASMMGSNQWEAVTNLILPSSPFRFVDTTSSNATHRFYRAIAE